MLLALLAILFRDDLELVPPEAWVKEDEVLDRELELEAALPDRYRLLPGAEVSLLTMIVVVVVGLLSADEEEKRPLKDPPDNLRLLAFPTLLLVP